MNRFVQAVAVLCVAHAAGRAPVAAAGPGIEIDVTGAPAARSFGGPTPTMPVTFGFPGNGQGGFGMMGSPSINLQLMDPGRSTPSPVLAPIDAAVRGHLKIPGDQGLMVSQVTPQSPAWAAGIRDQDILLTLGDSPLANPADLTKKLKEAGEKPLPLTLLRGGEKMTVQVQPRIEVGLGPIASDRVVYMIGATMAPVDPLLRSQLKLPEGQGLTVRHVEDQGPAAKMGLAQGDLLLTLNGKPVDSEQTLYTLVQAEGDQPVELVVIHKGARKSISIRPVQKIAEAIHVNLIGTTVGPRGPAGPGFPGTMNAKSIPGKLLGNFTPLPSITFEPKGMIRPEMFKEGKLAMPSVPAAKQLDEMKAQLDSLRKAVDELAKAIKEKK